jgi:hypothetical protein
MDYEDSLRRRLIDELKSDLGTLGNLSDVPERERATRLATLKRASEVLNAVRTALLQDQANEEQLEAFQRHLSAHIHHFGCRVISSRENGVTRWELVPTLPRSATPHPNGPDFADVGHDWWTVLPRQIETEEFSFCSECRVVRCEYNADARCSVRMWENLYTLFCGQREAIYGFWGLDGSDEDTSDSEESETDEE